MLRSEVEVDDFSNPQPAKSHTESHSHEQFGVIEQALCVFSIEEDHDDQQEGWQGHEDQGLQSTFRRQCVDQSHDAESFANDVCKSLQNLAEIASNLPLDEDGDDDDDDGGGGG
ncbi:MAG TPA: hypothetical protein DCR20_12580, partial [Planctomycetaceae bacterium]|nr:hypothetical protein [Planctomycetaceae bacterium]